MDNDDLIPIAKFQEWDQCPPCAGSGELLEFAGFDELGQDIGDIVTICFRCKGTGKYYNQTEETNE